MNHTESSFSLLHILTAEDLRGLEHLFDIILCSKDYKEFPAHKVVLAIQSQFFREKLLKKDKGVLRVSEIEGSILGIIVEYIYTGKVSADDDRIGDVLKAAHILKIETLLNTAMFFEKVKLCANNCVALIQAADEIDHGGILKSSLRFVEINFVKILHEKRCRIEDLKYKYLEKLLSSDSLNVLTEFEIWKCIEMWVNKVKSKRIQYLKSLILLVRFNTYENDLYKEMESHSFFEEDSPQFEFLKDASSHYQKTRTPNVIYFVMKFINTSDLNRSIEMYLTYDQNIDFWRNISFKDVYPDVILHCFGSVLIMYEAFLNLMYCFDIVTNTFHSIEKPNMTCNECKLVKLAGEVYALGVSTKVGEKFCPVEKYDSITDTWDNITSYHAITQGEVTVINDKLYIIGTIAGSRSEKLVAQIFDPFDASGDFLTISAPKMHRSHFALTVHTGKIFILGGKRKGKHLTTVEVYDPNRNEWSFFKPLPFSYMLPKAIIIEDKLVVYESICDKEDPIHCPPVVWEEECHLWRFVKAPSVLYDLNKYQFCAIQDATFIMDMTRENRHPDTVWEESPFYYYLNS